MKNKIKVAVTGLSVSRPTLKYYNESRDTTLSFVHDIDEQKARTVAAELSKTQYTSHFEDLLNSDVDMIDVSTPNHVHAEQAIAALQAGKHVLCQKPMAPTLKECRLMCDTAKEVGKQLGIQMFMLGQPLYRTLREMIQKGYIGKVVSLRQRNAHRGPYRMKDKNHWRAKAANIGGGSFMQLGIHYLNLLQWMLDDEIIKVTGFAKNLHCQHSIEGEDVVAAAGEFRKGPLIVMESSYASVGNAFAVYGTEGHFTVSGDTLILEANAFFKNEFLEYPGSAFKVGDHVKYSQSDLCNKLLPIDDPHIQNLAFARAIRDGGNIPVSSEIGLRDVAIIQAIYRAAENSRKIEVQTLIDEI